MREKCLDVLTRRVTLGLEGGVKSWTPGRNETEDGGGINGRSDEGPGAARSARRQGHSGHVRGRRHEDEGRLLPELGYFVGFFRFSSRSSRERRRSRSAETSSRRRSASASAPSRFGSARVAAIPQPAREAQSWKMRSTSRWLKTMPSRLDFIDR